MHLRRFGRYNVLRNFFLFWNMLLVWPKDVRKWKNNSGFRGYFSPHWTPKNWPFSDINAFLFTLRTAYRNITACFKSYEEEENISHFVRFFLCPFQRFWWPVSNITDKIRCLHHNPRVTFSKKPNYRYKKWFLIWWAQKNWGKPCSFCRGANLSAIVMCCFTPVFQAPLEMRYFKHTPRTLQVHHHSMPWWRA